MTGFPIFEEDGVYEIYTRGGHEFTVVVTDPGNVTVAGHVVHEEDLRTYYPDRTKREYVESQRCVGIAHAAIDARVYLGPLDHYEEDENDD